MIYKTPVRPLRLHPKRRRPACDQLATLQHFAELGRLSASLLHEISNPLTTAILELEQAYHPQNEITQARQSLHIIKKYLEAARQQVRHESPRVNFTVKSQLEQVKRIVRPLARSASVDLQFGSIPACRLYGDPVKFQHIVANLIMNAIDAYRQNSASGLVKPVRIEFEVHTNSFTMHVIDWGEGIASRHLARIFEPFFSTKDHSGSYGLGIGLAMVKQYVTIDFRGSISVRSSRRHGTRFSFTLPCPSV